MTVSSMQCRDVYIFLKVSFEILCYHVSFPDLLRVLCFLKMDIKLDLFIKLFPISHIHTLWLYQTAELTITGRPAVPPEPPQNGTRQVEMCISLPKCLVYNNYPIPF